MKKQEIEEFVARKKRMSHKQFTKLTDEMFGNNQILKTATYLGITWRQIYNYRKGVTDVALCLFQKKIMDRIPQSWISKLNG